MRTVIGYGLLALGLMLPAAASATGWQPSEEVKAYAITGRTGMELYRSIGERGPQAGPGRVIAHTTFKLTWTRKYEQQGNACTLTFAKPKLAIIYTLPKAPIDLPAATKASWDSFIAGVRTHERWHGETIIEMVKEIETLSNGFSVPDDPGCKKIRPELTVRLGELSNKQRQRGRDFDRVEMSEGGNIQQLILKLVNGP
jgi:predicted secreted Zn-dependent protease